MYKQMYDSEVKKELFRILENSTEVFVVDTETTGLSSKKDYIIQFSAKKYHVAPINGGYRLDEISFFDKYMRPPFYIQKVITDITGITNEMLKDKPTESDVISEIKEYLGPNPVFIGYNEAFDFRMISAMYERQKLGNFEPAERFDVMKAAKDLINKDKVDSFKQEELAKRCRVTEGIKFHSAIDDVECTKRLLQLFINQYVKKSTVSQTEQTEQHERPEEAVEIKSVNQWMKNGHKRLYVELESGIVFYDQINDSWRGKNIPIETIDVRKVHSCVEQFLKLSAGENLKDVLL